MSFIVGKQLIHLPLLELFGSRSGDFWHYKPLVCSPLVQSDRSDKYSRYKLSAILLYHIFLNHLRCVTVVVASMTVYMMARHQFFPISCIKTLRVSACIFFNYHRHDVNCRFCSNNFFFSKPFIKICVEFFNILIIIS